MRPFIIARYSLLLQCVCVLLNKLLIVLKGLGSSHSNLMIEWEKQIIYLRFLGINQILSFHILRNLKRFPMKPDIRITTFLGIQNTKNYILRNFKRFSMKPNIRIATFLGIQIIRNHIFKNLDVKSNMDSLVPNIT